MTPTEIFTAAALVAVLGLAAWWLLVRDRGTPAGHTLTAELPLPRGRQQYVADADGHPLPQWGFLDSLAVALLVVVGIFAAVITAFALLSLVGLALPDFDAEAFADTTIGTAFFHLLQWAATIGLPLLYLRARGYRFDRYTFGFRSTRLGFALGIWLAVMIACYFVFPGVYISLVESYELFELPEQEVVQPFGLTWGGLVIALITVAVATPVVEEFFFRGVIHQGLEKRLGFFAGAVLSSGLFALAHYPYWGLMPILFSYGFGFAILLRSTRSIWPPIIGHFFVNFLAVLVNYSELF
ncbi:MAG: CPBP family intramembrane glutamic endopeptidase [Thermoleophilia bacterium]